VLTSLQPTPLSCECSLTPFGSTLCLRVCGLDLSQGSGMRRLAFWGVCPDTGPACFSGRFTPACTCGTARAAGHKRSARSSLQQPSSSNDSRYQTSRSDAAPAAVASLDWEGDWEDFDSAPPTSKSQDQSQPWDKGFFAPVPQSTQQKPLKINRDLLLVSTYRKSMFCKHHSI